MTVLLLTERKKRKKNLTLWNEKFADTPVVMLSSKDGVFDKARGRMVGSQDYLTKSFTKDQLLQAVQLFGAAKQGEV